MNCHATIVGPIIITEAPIKKVKYYFAISQSVIKVHRQRENST